MLLMIGDMSSIPDVITLEVVIAGIRYLNSTDDLSVFGHVPEHSIQRDTLFCHSVNTTTDPVVRVIQSVRVRGADQVAVYPWIVHVLEESVPVFIRGIQWTQLDSLCQPHGLKRIM